eukprot:scaffold3213_cov202-Prasinococcus_capsulatus_cf.AAC.2
MMIAPRVAPRSDRPLGALRQAPHWSCTGGASLPGRVGSPTWRCVCVGRYVGGAPAASRPPHVVVRPLLAVRRARQLARLHGGDHGVGCAAPLLHARAAQPAACQQCA